MKRLTLLVMPLMTLSLLASCNKGGGNKPDETFTITWVNYNDEVLEVDKGVKKGEMPHYDGETPTRSEGTHTYSFSGWDSKIEPVTESKTYKAVFVPNFTTIDISIPEDANDYTFLFGFTLKEGCVLNVDWGDGETSNEETSHTYSDPGDYRIIIDNITSIVINLGFRYVKRVDLGNYNTSIVDAAFAYCSSLPSITIPSSITSIGLGAFSDCTLLQTITFLDNSRLTSIGWSAFYGCSSLVFVTIPSSVTSIDAFAFAYCSSLTSINIPSSVTEIGKNVFEEDTNLATIDLTSFTINDDIPTCNEENSWNATLEVVSEEMAYKFKDSNKGWPDSLDKYHWPDKPEPKLNHWYTYEDWWNYCSNGNADSEATPEDIGKEVKVKVNNLDHKIRLIDVDHINAEGEEPEAHCTFEFVNLITDSKGAVNIEWNVKELEANMPNNYNFPDSTLNDFLNKNSDCIFNILPKGLHDAIKEVSKNVNTTSLYTPTSYRTHLFPLSQVEIINNHNEAPVSEGTIYRYYQNGGERIKASVGGGSDSYWLRSPYSVYSYRGCIIENLGRLANIDVNKTTAVAPAFCI